MPGGGGGRGMVGVGGAGGGGGGTKDPVAVWPCPEEKICTTYKCIMCYRASTPLACTAIKVGKGLKCSLVPSLSS